ncbi:MAG: InlB B-repeat-containing protein [Christensenella sp.]|jgi:uncharacterized repeat protein (TIGR02543 family)|nr:InlB B-repeat-containing protein [Christensenella sp.]
MNQFKKPLAMLLALVMLCGAFLSDGKLAFAEGEPEPTVIDVTEGEKPDGTPAGDVREAGAPAGDPTPEPTQEPVPEYTVTFVVGEDSFPVTVAENADATVPEGANAAITAYEKANNQVFVGWDKGFTSIVADTEVTAQFATATATLTIHYVDDSGEQLRASYEAVLAIGAEYSVASPEIQGYVVESGKETVSGTMAAGGVTVDVKYSVTDAKYTVQHYVEQIDGSFIKEAEETFSAQTGTTVTAVAKSYEGCTAPSPMPSAMVAAEGTVIAVYYTRNTYTVSFDANGGSYVSSIFDVKHGAKVAAPAEPTRAGYTFAGWLNGETAFDFINTPVTGNLTLTAKWKPKLVNYTVVYWQENADDDGYSYVETATKQGYAGSEATFDEKDYAHFVLGANSDRKTIAGDGSTIVNVYYQRQTYTLTFTTGASTLTCGKEEHRHTWRCYNWRGELTCNREEHTHTDACYDSDSGVIYTITAKYDADISHIWSDPAITAYSDEGYVWKSSVTGKYYSFLEKMPGQNITLTATKWEGNKYTWYYYLEVLPGQNTTGLTLRTDGGRTYYLYNTTTVYGNDVSLTYDEDYFPITGFRQRDKNVPSFTNRIAYLYYLRESYKLDFINGTTEKSETVAFEASIADKGYTPTVRPEGVAADAVFAGWYDNGDFMGEPYDFTDKTMPAKNLVFYAKWASRTYTVTFMNGTAEVGKLSDVAYGTNVSAQAPSGLTPPAEGVQFAGWANASGATADMTVTGDVTFYAKWHTTQTYGYTVKYVDANGTEIAKAESFTGTPNTTVIAQAKEIAGYELNDAQSKSVLLDADNKEIVFKYRYIGTYSYTVRYLLKDTETEVFNPKVVTNVSSRTVTENAKYKDGYKLVSDTPQTITLSSDASKNVITFYYEKLGEQTMIRYWVKHVIDNGDGTTTLRAIEMKNEAVDKGKSLTVAEADVEKKTFEGYKYDRADTLPSTFTDNSSSNIITLYYVKDETQTKTLSYTVEHYLDNALQTADTMTVEEKVWVLDPATTLTVTQESVAHKNYTNAVFTHSDPATIPGAIQNGGVIKLYYVTKTAITITAKSDSKPYDGTALVNGGYDLTGTLKAGDTLDVTVSGSVTNVADNKADNNVITSVKVLRNGIDVTAQYTITKVPGTLTINQRPVTFTGESATKPYTGSEQEINGITEDGLLEGHTYTGLTYSAKGKDADEYNGAFSGTVKIMNGNADVTGNYAVTKTPGKLTITAVTGEVTVTIKENSATYTYDGTEKTVTGYTVKSISNPLYTVNDFTFSGTASASGTKADFYPMQVNASDFTNKNANFSNVKFVIEDGGLTINPVTSEIVVTITENSATHTYDGTEKTVTGYTVTNISNTLYSESDFAFNGTASVSGTSEGFYPMTLTASDFENKNENFTNVTFKIVDGGLTINPTDAEVIVTITENSATYTYDGTEKTVTGYTVTSISNPLYTVNDFAFSGTASASGTNEGFYPMQLTVNDFRNTNGNFTNVAFVIVDGGLTINPVSDKVTVTIKENSATHTYDGTEKTVTGYTVTSISNPLYTVDDFAFNGTASVSGMNEGFYPMTLAASDFRNTNTNFANVEFVIVDGGLTINPITDEVTVTITENSATHTYDGTEKTVTGYTVTSISNGLYTASDFTFSGTASASGTEADFYPMQVKADDFTNKNTNFSNVKFVIVDGGLTIEPIETPIVITADSNEKEYDGTALTDSGYTYTEGVLVSGDVLTAVVAGSQTDAGSSANKVTSYKVMRGEEEVTANYTFGDSVDGTLKVTPRAITITVSDASKLFGTADPIFTGSITKGELVNEGDLGTIEYYRINAGVEAAGTYNAALSAKLKEENGNYAVTVVNGSFTIYLPEPEPIIPTPTPDIPLDVPQTGDGAMLHTIIGFACIAMAGLLGKLRRKENEGEA